MARAAAATPRARQAAANPQARATRSGARRTAPTPATEPETDAAAERSAPLRQPRAAQPPSLEWLDKLPIFAVADSAPSVGIAPFWQVSRVGLMLGAGASPEELADESSPLRITSDLIRPRLIEYLHLPSDSATSAALAAGFADFWRDSALPEFYLSGILTPQSIRTELLDGCRLRMGGTEARRVEEGRLVYAVDSTYLAVLGRVLKAAPAAEHASLLQRLLSLFYRSALPPRCTLTSSILKHSWYGAVGPSTLTWMPIHPFLRGTSFQHCAWM